MKRAQAILLAAVSGSRQVHIGGAKKLLISWWKDLDKLSHVSNYCRDVRRQALTRENGSVEAAVTILRAHLKVSPEARHGRLTVARAMKDLGRAANRDRINSLRAFRVDERTVHHLQSLIAEQTFDLSRFPPALAINVKCVATSSAPLRSIVFEDYKARYLVEIPQQIDTSFAEHIGDDIRSYVLGCAFADRVTAAGLTAINSPAERANHNFSEAEMQSLIASIAAACESLRLSGEEPVVLVGRGAPRGLLRPNRWGGAQWQCPLPQGIDIRPGNAAVGEIASVYLNNVPVVDFETLYGDCYVVPLALVNTLEVVGVNLASTVTLTWERLNDERLRFIASWHARLN